MGSKSTLHGLSRPLAIGLTLSLGTLALLPTVFAGGPGERDRAKERPVQAKPDPHSSYVLPVIEIDEVNHRVRVETPDGPVWIRQCIKPGPDGEFEKDPALSAPKGGGTPEAPGATAPPRGRRPGGGRNQNITGPVGTPVGGGVVAGAGPQTPASPALGFPGCLRCHTQIENATLNMFGMDLNCVFCHGGNEYAATKATAHVQSDGSTPMDITVPGLTTDLDYQRFLNPSNLRVVDDVCGLCHGGIVYDVRRNMMATTAGHST